LIHFSAELSVDCYTTWAAGLKNDDGSKICAAEISYFAEHLHPFTCVICIEQDFSLDRCIIFKQLCWIFWHEIHNLSIEEMRCYRLLPPREERS